MHHHQRLAQAQRECADDGRKQKQYRKFIIDAAPALPVTAYPNYGSHRITPTHPSASGNDEHVGGRVEEHVRRHAAEHALGELRSRIAAERQ